MDRPQPPPPVVVPPLPTGAGASSPWFASAPAQPATLDDLALLEQERQATSEADLAAARAAFEAEEQALQNAAQQHASRLAARRRLIAAQVSKVVGAGLAGAVLGVLVAYLAGGRR